MEYFLIKVIHILSATLLFGTGLGSAFYKWMADRGGDLQAMAKTNRSVVIADWLFTTPTVIIQPITGLWLINLMGIPLDQSWILITLILYIIAGACWLPVVWLQIRMRDLAADAVIHKRSLDERYHYYTRIWFWLGIPAFASMVLIYLLMVFKPNFVL
ncbi:MAG: DUF2269 domain-containing protein [Candidatus Thiodiazotropha sp. (ex Ctena orbiculata)]|nr:DUF2269 domain-containing protein [Candidatus Thiodiazotropha taylori]MCG8096506.1 DUF2269 domain-containing protein [Candidatus Thiodiazotropha endolucinida]MCG7968865.1 DUF2269 domain-containing protein [Candidatus Thiodiazotropha taylori]MCG7996222.1 DUF2269 domain-containing protein [Candidatus Thiodiazotropha taylori]MCG8038948.1 DUF2269 domain-containing protein [Candidatus Thiodiazotropha taylori]